MRNKKTKIYLDKGKYPCIIVDNNYENSGMLLIKQLRYKLSSAGFIANYNDLIYVGYFSSKQVKKLKQYCINNES